jgi:hypothetical protein
MAGPGERKRPFYARPWRCLIFVGVLGWRFVMYREAAFMYDKRDHADG